MRILSVDPGKMTGYVVWTDGEREEGELAHEPFLDFAWDLVKAGDIDVIVCERFIITAQTGKLSQAPWSLSRSVRCASSPTVSASRSSCSLQPTPSDSPPRTSCVGLHGLVRRVLVMPVMRSDICWCTLSDATSSTHRC